MTEQSFELIIAGEVDDEQVEELYGKVSDMFVSTEGTLTRIGVDRESDSMAAALLSAILDVESIGLKVNRIEPDDLVYATEIADLADRSRQSVDLLIRGERGPGDFPLPVSHVGGRNPLWRWNEVAEWLSRYEGREIDPSERRRRQAIAVINGLLEARRAAQEDLGPKETAQMVKWLEREADLSSTR